MFFRSILKSSQGFRRLIHYYGFFETLKFSYFRYLSLLKAKSLDLSKSHIIQLNNFHLTTVPYDFGISSELLLYGIHEVTTTEIFSKELKKGMVCLDVGSNIGYFALLEREIVGDSGKVICIEPSPKIFEILKNNVTSQDISNIEFYNFACGDKDKHTKFVTSKFSNLSQVIDDDIVNSHESFIETNIVQIKKIDTFVMENSISQIDFIRFDTEGYEEKIISGMHNTIMKFHPILSFELHRTILGDKKTIELLKKIQSYGYVLKYCISGINCAKIGGLKYVKPLTIEKLIELIKLDKIPGGFGVYFEKKN